MSITKKTFLNVNQSSIQTLISLILGIATLSVNAQSNQPATVVKEDFVLTGDTVFVRPGKQPYGWTMPLRERLNNYYQPSKIKTVVFVNMGSVGHWEGVGSEVLIQKWLNAASATTIIVGECENYCAGWYAGGRRRLMAKGASIDLKTPISFESRTLQPKFPNTQFAMFERETATPAVLPYRDIFVEAFSKGGLTGSTKFTLGNVQFCKERNPEQECKTYDGLNAYKVGLVTDPDPVDVQLPNGW